MEILPGFDLNNNLQFNSAISAAKMRRLGERAEQITIKNALIIEGIKLKYEPRIQELKQRIATREKQINDEKTSAAEKVNLMKDLKREKKALVRLENKQNKALRPYMLANQVQNGVVANTSENLSLTAPSSNFRDFVAWADKWTMVHGKGAAQDSLSTTSFAPTMGWLPGTSTATH